MRQGELFQKFPLEPLKILGAWENLCQLLGGLGKFSLYRTEKRLIHLLPQKF